MSLSSYDAATIAIMANDYNKPLVRLRYDVRGRFRGFFYSRSLGAAIVWFRKSGNESPKG